MSENINMVDALLKTIYNQDQKIADLEARFAESQNTVCKDISELTKMATEKDRKIEELKQQLAESEEKYNMTNRAYWKLVDKQDNDFLQYEKLIGENHKLKQQLAEKDLEIKNLTLGYFESETNKPVLTTTQIINQVKISFAVEQLEKVKEYADIDYRKHCYIGAVKLDKFIDQQINELKEQQK